MKLAALLLSTACLSAQAQAQVQPPIVLDGQYSARTDEMSLQIIGERVCFVPDKAQWSRLPRPAATHAVWFCFSNDGEARRLLRVPARQADNCGWQARARIVIDTYQAYVEQGDGNDMARLASVVKVAQPNAIACE
ncbi:MAG: hypothetical protein ACOH2S_02070 [Janthinobacterium svalbardensis]|uniref:Secreted protein n=1 Tax=Janthinobacterium svalbardensis TaxID=368607 RepID=A0A290X129_9BURK|nr:hypothetical protein [Janthinobacterium svalbardensis]ATD62851.1 hypothetical protein CNX70_23930 [Janthinobacterium svalbardensis]